MNKKSKQALKTIVKECLIEILAEGLVGNNQATLSESRELRGTIHEAHDNMQKSRNITSRPLNSKTHVTSKSKQTTQKRSSYLDSITMGIDKKLSSQGHSDNQVSQKIKNVTNDPIMQDIFADTAATTLREQKENGRAQGPSVMAGGDQAAKIVDQSLPEDLFGETSSKWANLAFAPSIKR